MTSVSRQLFDTSNGLGRFDKIEVILPKTWSGTECLNGRNVAADMSGYTGNPDFRISTSDPMFGSKPVALQFGQCGVQGLEVRVPFEVLTRGQNLSQQTG